MKRLLLVLLLLVPSAAYSQVTYDTQANSFCLSLTTLCGGAGLNTLTYSLTVGANSNRQLAVFAFIGCNSGEVAPTVTGITYASVAMSSTISLSAGSNSQRGYMFLMPAGTEPATGANNVVVTMSGGLIAACITGGTGSVDALNSGAISTYGVDQTAPLVTGSPKSNSGSGTSATLTGFTSGASDLGVNSLCAGGGITSTTETSRWAQQGTTDNSCGTNRGATAAAADTSWSWTIPSDTWLMVGGVLKAASAGVTCAPTLTVIGVGRCN